MPWEEDAKLLMDELLEAEPVLVRISAAKRMRDQAEADARDKSLPAVNAARLAALFGRPRQEVAA
jgi:chlorophyllide a reductase subunit Z